jgi:GNAT superfamily N-acetyltransferase
MSVSKAEDIPAGLLITRLVPEQWAIYRQVRLAALTDAPYAFGSTLERERAFDDDRWQQRIRRAATFLALREGRPVGTATGVLDDPQDEFHVPGAWQLVAMWVTASARGIGAADLLVQAVADHARAEGASALVLWVTDVNDRARAFYRRMGFASTGARQPVRPSEPDHWEEQMARQLD